MVRYKERELIPKPAMREDTEPFWTLLNEKKQLHFQRCKHCKTYMHPPRPVCYNCHYFDMEWTPSTGKGYIYSFVVYQRPTYPAFEVPYECVLVEMEEGVRLVSNMTADCKPEEIYIGMPVEAVMEQVSDDVTLPKFKRRDT